MPKITTLDKSTIQTIRGEIALALKDIENRYGIVLKTGSCRYSSSAATMKLEIATIGSQGEVVDVEMAALRANYRLLGLEDKHLTQQFRLGGKTFQLKGYKAARYAKPFSLHCVDDGKTYVARETQVKVALGLPAFTYGR